MSSKLCVHGYPVAWCAHAGAGCPAAEEVNAERVRLYEDARRGLLLALEEAREERDTARYEAGVLAEKWGKAVRERDEARQRVAELEREGGGT